MKPTYLLALLLSVPAGLMILWIYSGIGGPSKAVMAAAIAPAIIICIAAKIDEPKQRD